MTKPITHTLDVPGAVLTYDVREPEDSRRAPAVVHLRLADGGVRLRAAGEPLR